MMLCATAALSVSAQQDGQRGSRHEFSPERYRQRLEEFVTREACLTAEEAQKVLPTLHEMMEHQRKCHDEAREAMRSCGNDASEADYERAVTKALTLDLESKRIEAEYYKKMHGVLTWKKLHSIRVALWKYQREALRRFSPNNQGTTDPQGQRRHHKQHPQAKNN